MTKPTILLLLLTITKISFGLTWPVGATRTYKKPSDVAALVQPGDTVAIDAGVYNSDTARWAVDNLVLKGVGGMAHLKANGASYGGKAIWVIAGKNTTVQNIEFSLCACASHNGAGIRQEGINLTVQHCYFHDNENGILAGDNITSDIVIENSEFYNNGYGDGQTHNLYINHVNSLTFRYNYTHHAIVGHELKSRAYNNYILYNRFANEATGTTSRNIDLPNGGFTVILGNEIHQGTQTQNSNLIGYGLEGLSNPTASKIYVINNTLVNERSTSIFVSVQNATVLCKMNNNIFAGNGTILTGTTSVTDTSNNLYLSIAAAKLVNAATYDYHLLSTSPAVNKGIHPGMAGTFSLKPVMEYTHPANALARTYQDSIDIGAHEYLSPGGLYSKATTFMDLKVSPNPSNGNFTIICYDESKQLKAFQLFDVSGKLVWQETTRESTITISDKALPCGMYLLSCIQNEARSVVKIMVQGD